MSIREAEMIRNAQKPFEYNAAEGDEVLIVSDTEMDPVVWSVLNKAARALDIEPTIALIAMPEMSNAAPTPPVGGAMLESDLILLAASKALAHSSICQSMLREHGKKMVLMSEITPDTLTRPAASADHEEILAVGKRIKAKWDAGDEVEITAPAGTDLVADITGCEGSALAGFCDPDGEEGGSFRVAAFPDGEVPVNPVPGTSDGTIVWDTTMHEIGLIEEPIRATVEDGFVTEIAGGREATKLRNLLAEYDDDPNTYNVGEISINTNPGAQITGRLREDKKAAGYMHIAVGRGGDVDAPVHFDGVIEAPTVTIDGEVIVDDGEITV